MKKIKANTRRHLQIRRAPTRDAFNRRVGHGKPRRRRARSRGEEALDAMTPRSHRFPIESGDA